MIIEELPDRKTKWHEYKVVRNEPLLEYVWEENYFGSDRVVDDLLRRLRQKMPNLNVETIYGYGNRLTA